MKVHFTLIYSLSHWLFLSLALNWAPAVHCSLEPRHLNIERTFCRALKFHFHRIVSRIIVSRIPTPKFKMISTFWGPLLVIWQVSFGCWITCSISNWQNPYNRVFFGQAEFFGKHFFSEKTFVHSGPNLLQNESSQFSQIYLSPEKLRKMFTF